jgi:hypothetical protein
MSIPVSRPSSQSVMFNGQWMPIEQAVQMGWKSPSVSVEDALIGRARDIEADPRLKAAMAALNPDQAKSDSLAAFTDMTAAQAGSQADMLREQMGQAGIQLNDPAAQARMRAIETQRMQANQVGGREAQAAGQGAAAQAAQLRLQQMSMANPFYAQYGGMKANQQTGQYFTGNRATPQVPAPTGDPDRSPWTPPGGAASPASNATYRVGGKDVTAEEYAAHRAAVMAQKPGGDQKVAQTWNFSQPNWAKASKTTFTPTAPVGTPRSNYDQGANLGKYVTNLWGPK